MVVTIKVTEDQDVTDRLSTGDLQIGTGEIEENNYAHFHHGEFVVCNDDKEMMDDTATYSFKIKPGWYVCTYRGYEPGAGLLAAVTMIDIAQRSRLSLQHPSFSSQGFTLRYTPDASAAAYSIQGIASDASGNSIKGSFSSSDSGVYDGPSGSSLSGKGEIVLQRTCFPKFQGVFKNVSATYQSLASVEVTWSH
jgi:hypothetical protein